MIGHMVSQIMEAQGYIAVDEDVSMSGNVLFQRGTCYARRTKQ